MKKANKGFTLVELIIVIAILAIIMLIAIPNFSGIQQRMKVRADKSTAAQIGKAVRVWYTDYSSDPLLYGTLLLESKAAANNDTKADDNFFDGAEFVDYRDLTGIDDYSAKTYFPTSLLDANSVAVDPQCYVVGLTSADASAGKVCVAIVPGTKSGETITPTIGTADDDADESANGVLAAFKADTTEGKTLDVDYDGTAGKFVAYVEP